MKLELEMLKKHAFNLDSDMVRGIVSKGGMLYVNDKTMVLGYDLWNGEDEVLSIETLKKVKKQAVDITGIIPEYVNSFTLRKDDVVEMLNFVKKLRYFGRDMTMTIGYGYINLACIVAGETMHEYKLEKEYYQHIGFKYTKEKEQKISFNITRLITVLEFMIDATIEHVTFNYDGVYQPLHITTTDFHSLSCSPFALLMPIRLISSKH